MASGRKPKSLGFYAGDNPKYRGFRPGIRRAGDRSTDQLAGIHRAAEKLRRTQTPSESILGRFLEEQFPDIEFAPQVVLLDKHIVDFASEAHKLIIEVDGWHHKQGAQFEYDQTRDAELAANGYKVLRFLNPEIIQSPIAVRNRIAKVLQ